MRLGLHDMPLRIWRPLARYRRQDCDIRNAPYIDAQIMQATKTDQVAGLRGCGRRKVLLPPAETKGLQPTCVQQVQVEGALIATRPTCRLYSLARCQIGLAGVGQVLKNIVLRGSGCSPNQEHCCQERSEQELHAACSAAGIASRLWPL